MGVLKMPISGEEWNAGKTEKRIKTEILRFLRSNREMAFTELEILEGLGYVKLVNGLMTFPDAKNYGITKSLEVLIKEGTVAKKIIRTEIKKDDGGEYVEEVDYYMATS